MPSAAFPSSITFHVAEQQLSRLFFGPGTLVPLTPGTGNPPPPVTIITPPTMHMLGEPDNLQPAQEAPIDWISPTVEPPPEAAPLETLATEAPVAPPAAGKRKPRKKHRRQTLLPA